MIIVEDTTNPSSKATCINSLLMWLREDVQRTAWIANAGQEPCSRDVERSELAGAAGVNDPADRGFEIVHLKQHLPSRRAVPSGSDWQQPANRLLAPLPHNVTRMRRKRLLCELPSEETTVELLKKGWIVRQDFRPPDGSNTFSERNRLIVVLSAETDDRTFGICDDGAAIRVLWIDPGCGDRSAGVHRCICGRTDIVHCDVRHPEVVVRISASNARYTFTTQRER